MRGCREFLGLNVTGTRKKITWKCTALFVCVFFTELKNQCITVMYHLPSIFRNNQTLVKFTPEYQTFNLLSPWYVYYYRRNFISAGAAAGVASAFGAPVGGLLFAMEEVSSFWSMKLSWQVFFCCMISTFTTDLFNSAFHNFKYQGDFGLFRSQNYIIFKAS